MKNVKITEITEELENIFNDDIEFSISEEDGAESFCVLDFLRVEDDVRGKGLGTSFLKEFARIAAKHYTGASLTAFPEADEKAVTGKEIKNLMRWYEKSGWSPLYGDQSWTWIEDEAQYLYKESITQGTFEYSIMTIDYSGI